MKILLKLLFLMPFLAVAQQPAFKWAQKIGGIN
jgi:hypothetical protein